MRLALSRSRELLADAGSVELTKNPDAMISALRKIENRGELAGATSAVMELCVDNPREGFADLFATHPSVESRVQALVKYAGGHDPGPLALPSDAAGEPDDRPPEPETVKSRRRCHRVRGAMPKTPPARPRARRQVPGPIRRVHGAATRGSPRVSAAPLPRRSVNDTGRINPNGGLKNLNSPLFLPCSRPKQAWG